MKPVVQLVRIAHGSHLYGTSTPTSDHDFKGVHLPSGKGIVMGRAEDVINTGVTSKAAGADKNDAHAIDSDSYSLQKFFDMLMKGDTVATEILFASVVEADPRWSEVQAVGRQLLNRQCKGFVGYCVRQAAKYGIKGSRMSAVKALVDVLKLRQLQLGSPAAKLGEIDYMLRDFAERHEHAEWVNIPSPNGADLWHIRCCDRAMPMTSSVGEAIKVYTKVWDNYGERARAAMTNEGIDWKAMSHAVRVARQAIELLNTGQITFPRPDAAELLAIKLGQLPYAEVSQMLESLVETVHVASERSALPERSDQTIADTFVRQHYHAQVCDQG
jgi:hypothetical protein